MAASFTVLDDAQALARHAAAWLAQKLDAHAQGTSAVCLSGGATPRVLYETLVKIPLPWTRVHRFWCDERFVPLADPRSNYGMARKLLLERAPIRARTSTPYPLEAIRRRRPQTQRKS